MYVFKYSIFSCHMNNYSVTSYCKSHKPKIYITVNKSQFILNCLCSVRESVVNSKEWKRNDYSILYMTLGLTHRQISGDRRHMTDDTWCELSKTPSETGIDAWEILPRLNIWTCLWWVLTSVMIFSQWERTTEQGNFQGEDS